MSFTCRCGICDPYMSLVSNTHASAHTHLDEILVGVLRALEVDLGGEQARGKVVVVVLVVLGHGTDAIVLVENLLCADRVLLDGRLRWRGQDSAPAARVDVGGGGGGGGGVKVAGRGGRVRLCEDTRQHRWGGGAGHGRLQDARLGEEGSEGVIVVGNVALFLAHQLLLDLRGRGRWAGGGGQSHR